MTFQCPGTRSSIVDSSRLKLRSSCALVLPLTLALAILFVASVASGCRKPVEPVTLTFLDPQGLLDLGDRRMVSDEALHAFTAETGIKVNHLPTPQDNRAQIDLILGLLQRGAATPDVYSLDSIWSGTLAQYLIDLKPYASGDQPTDDPEVLNSYVVDGKLIGIPYHPNSSVLYYRADLLREYGYSLPPKNWDELEKMALRIQNGERAKGKKDFWGFVFPATVRESLSHIALEWQVDEGGGHVIEADKTISVNNPNAIHAWERGARWVGSISPPSVLSYSEWDASNDFWIAGDAAFHRGWADYFQRHPPNEPFKQHAGVTSVPAGKVARVDALGGWALGVSRFSVHPAEAIKLVQFLTKREAQLEEQQAHSAPPWTLQFYELPQMLARKYPWSARANENLGGHIVSRPSNAAGAKYEEVSLAYAEAVHSVLAHQATGAAAAASLERELVRITGFPVVHK